MPNDATKKIKWAPKLFIILAVVLITGLIGMSVFSRQRRGSSLTVDGNRIYVELAKTNAEREHGLCCRRSLPADQGMLFMYERPGNYRYWMKDTLIPLDMLWINSNKKIIYIAPSVQPGSYPKTFGPSQPAKYVLEVNAGYTKSHNITVGDDISF